MSTPQKATLTFLGGAGTVTGSKYLITLDDRRILVDAGMFQGDKQWRLKNRDEFPVDPSTISDVLLTHAHTDHAAYLPALVKHGFRGPIWATEATIRLAEIVLRDSGKLQEQSVTDAVRGGWSKHENPEAIYTTEDVERTLPLFRPVEFDTNVDIDGIWARWTRAGHILGSASIHVEFGNRSVLFSGDLGRHDHPILKDRATPPGADIVLVESTYGDREHPEPDVAHEDFAAAIRRTIERGGQVVVPAFAIDRTETVLHALVQMRREGRIPEVPVVVDGPMSLRALAVYSDTSLDELREDVTVADFTDLDLTAARGSRDSKELNKRTDPMIIISSSGMAEGGRVLYHLQRLLPDARNTVVLTGFQAEGTRGRALEDGARQVKINGRYVRVNAEIVRDREFSVHGDASDLLDWLKALDKEPEEVFVTHGEPQVAALFADRISDELGWVAVAPKFGEVVTLLGDETDD
ncbi:MBL fold metallo-hydrolase RNA specificity domain-containing protein [Tessaracoccus sp. ZS01]|uniref:MBL fold metallo-hydrolase RNA specificity domain-containing protein n=1 Tax=Tessaracoccus sp. ZS01 TaxID=1906324 RepID=UPI00096E8EFC|nr:MBL fold metallo-hydrolase [Tessaracoccus sp. ZS01]MCG6566923.1 MBL fold metallo-hydrolase [Tessaracoccus sp. ZS01]OMG58052.1 MBL fold metallo-hydrolase [Tessaracoccus sp. ZS01]